MLAVVAIAMTFSHALAVVPSVLGQRMRIGLATFGSGVVHVVVAFALGRWLGILGVLAAGVVSHGLVFPVLAWRPFAAATGMAETAILAEVVRPWALRFLPLVLLAIGLEQVFGVPSLPVTVATGGLATLAAMWYMRPLYLEFGPVRSLYDRLIAGWFAWVP